jgi:hypothetical protein
VAPHLVRSGPSEVCEVRRGQPPLRGSLLLSPTPAGVAVSLPSLSSSFTVSVDDDGVRPRRSIRRSAQIRGSLPSTVAEQGTRGRPQGGSASSSWPVLFRPALVVQEQEWSGRASTIRRAGRRRAHLLCICRDRPHLSSSPRPRSPRAHPWRRSSSFLC